MSRIKHNDKSLTIRLNEGLAQELVVAATLQGKSVSALVRDILAQIMKAHRAARDGDE